MAEPFDFHVFAHKDGRYQTAAASTSVTTEERRILEQFTFGQTNDSTYLKSLDTEPGVVWRRVGHRYALTRVRQGKPDEHGRATLRFESVLFEHERAGAVLSVLSRLVRGQWQEGDGQAVITPAARTSASLHPEVVSDATLAVDAGRQFRTSAEKANLRDVEAIIQRCFHGSDFGLMFKSLVEHANVNVNLVAGERATEVTTAPREEKPMRTMQSRPPAVGRHGRRGVIGTVLILALLLVNTGMMFLLLSRGGGDIGDAQENIVSEVAATRETIGGQVKGYADALATHTAGHVATTDLTRLEDRLNKQLAEETNRLSEETRKASAALHEKIVGARSEITGQIESVREDLAAIDGTVSKAKEEANDSLGRLEDDVRTYAANVASVSEARDKVHAIQRMLRAINMDKDDRNNLVKQLGDLDGILSALTKAPAAEERG